MIRYPEQFASFPAEVRRFVRTECMPLEALVDDTDEIREGLVQRMRDFGLFGHSIPDEYGGAGLTSEELSLVNIEISQVSATFRARFEGNTGIASESLIVDGTPEQKRRYLPQLASGKITGCFALTEPEAGSDASAQKTTAVRDGEHFIINGAKCFITNASIADLFTVFARTDPQSRGAHGVSAFLIERGTPELSTPKAYRKMGQHGSPVGEVILDNVRVHKSAIVGGLEGQDFRTDMRTLNKQRINLAGLCIGTGNSARGGDGPACAPAQAVRPVHRRVSTRAADGCREQHRGACRPCAAVGDCAQARRRRGRHHGSLHGQDVRLRDVRSSG